MADQSQTATNKQSEPALCKQDCGFFVSTLPISAIRNHRTRTLELSAVKYENLVDVSKIALHLVDVETPK